MVFSGDYSSSEVAFDLAMEGEVNISCPVGCYKHDLMGAINLCSAKEEAMNMRDLCIGWFCRVAWGVGVHLAMVELVDEVLGLAGVICS